MFHYIFLISQTGFDLPNQDQVLSWQGSETEMSLVWIMHKLLTLEVWSKLSAVWESLTIPWQIFRRNIENLSCFVCFCSSLNVLVSKAKVGDPSFRCFEIIERNCMSLWSNSDWVNTNICLPARMCVLKVSC